MFHSNRSVSQLLLGKHQEALSDAQQAAQLKPDWEKGHFRCGAALEAMGDLAKVCTPQIMCHSPQTTYTSTSSGPH